MELKELRIGNWVMGHHKPFRWGLKHFHLLKQSNLDEIIKEPIALTEEILLKCGFRDNEGRIVRHFHVKYVYYSVVSSDVPFSFKIGFSDGKEFFITNVEYLHQLQNIYFSLTGVELKVKLWKI